MYCVICDREFDDSLRDCPHCDEGSCASVCSLREFHKAFDIWFAEGVKGMRFDAEHADARDIAVDAATWAKDFLENTRQSHGEANKQHKKK